MIRMDSFNFVISHTDTTAMIGHLTAAISGPVPLFGVAAVPTSAFIAAVRCRRTRKLARLALTDAVTGLGNRRRLDHDLEASRTDSPVAVVMIDIDQFKRFNDDHGHVVGDEVLRQVADALRSQVRHSDVVYRYGGEEFCVLLAGATTIEAGEVAERIRVAVSRVAMVFDHPLTVSIGVALGTGANAAPTLRRADDALLKSKREGRDRVTLAAQPLLDLKRNELR
jgi:diguanylate cyclase (GGDEF)-like protein